jgi:hypothetical protein
VVPGGTHPPCAQCNGATEYIWRSNPASIQTDESFIGGKVIENLSHTPITVYSRTELKQAMEKHNAQQKIKWVPGDKHLINWAMGIDQYTLDAARVLVSRPGALKDTSKHDPAALESYQGSVRTVPKGE